MDYVVRESDYLLNVCPLTPQTRDMFDADVFSKMKDTAIFMNIGRGPSVVEEDLLAALRGGQIAGAYLDVFVDEPLPPDSEFWDLDNVFITPHHANYIPDIESRLVYCFAQNARVFGTDTPLDFVVDKERGY